MFGLPTSVSLLLTMGGFFLGIMSLLLTLYLYNKSRKYKKINYAKKSHTLIYNFNPNIDKLSLKYGETLVKNVTITFLAIWNSGNETIYLSDTSGDAPLSVYTADKKQVLETKIIYFSNKLNAFKIKKIDKDGFVMSFDYIGKKEGIILKIVHTGTSSKGITAVCPIKGAETPYLVKFIDKSARLLFEVDSSGVLTILSLLLGLIETLIFCKLADLILTFSFFSVGVAAFLTFLFSFITYISLNFIISKFSPKSWPPLNDFDIYREIYRK